MSLWRLATIIQHRATTYPTFDPTWYAPISVILAAVEVDVAMVCACVPVFWPVLRDGLGKIYVTKEIEITHDRRMGSADALELRSRHSSEANLRDPTRDLHMQWGSTKTTVNSTPRYLPEDSESQK